MSKSRATSGRCPESAACSRKIAAALGQSNASLQPSRLPTSASAHQSGRASPTGVTKPRWREMRRSELVTVPSFSPQACAGSNTSASSAVSVEAITSETTTKGQAAIARLTASASGRLSTGLVAMIHSAIIRPSATARNRSTALWPGVVAMVGAPQNSCTRAR